MPEKGAQRRRHGPFGLEILNVKNPRSVIEPGAGAHPDALAAATHVVGGNDTDGVTKYLEELHP